jgi:hypothetical protein
LSDKKHIPEGFSKLTVVIDDSSNFYLDKVFAKSIDSEFKFSRIFDTIHKGTVFTYDSLRNNEYEIVFLSLLNRNFKIPITIIDDTTIFIRKNQLPNFDTLQSITNVLSNMRQNDTICIAYTSSGCFHNYSNKTIIYKKENNFIAEFTTDTSHDYKASKILSIKKQLGIGFADTLHKLELGCIEGLKKQNDMQVICDKLMGKAKNNFDSMWANSMMFSSTASSAIFINKGNKVFVLSSNGINEIPYYSNFMKALNL